MARSKLVIAILEACGRQYEVTEGKFFDFDFMEEQTIGSKFTFDKVLMVVNDKDCQFGTPYLTNAKVTGQVLAHKLGAKMIVYKQKPKKGTRKKQGHRQLFTRVLIEKISV